MPKGSSEAPPNGVSDTTSLTNVNQRGGQTLRVRTLAVAPNSTPVATRTPPPISAPAPLSTASPPASSCPAIGFFVRGESPSGATTLASSLNVHAQVLTVYAYNAGGGPYTAFTFEPGTGFQLLLGVGALTPSQATTIGDNLMSEGYSNAMIRIMWEMNGDWESWGTQALSAAQYIATYQSVEQAFAAVPGNRFTYVWNLSAGTVEPGRTEFDTYPGDAYVSNVGIDVYDMYGDDGNVPAIVSFAHSHGKPISIDEWGLSTSDDPAFIDTISAVVHNPAADVILHDYFSYGSATITNWPQSEAEYEKDFGGPC